MPEHGNKKIRVLVADDSALMRKLISDIINNDPFLEVAATARNGEDALKKVLALKPDVVTLDIEMPIMDGLAALERIMKEHPVPVIMLSALTRSGTTATITALQKGAVDFIAKPSGSISIDIDNVRQEIINKVKIAAEVRVGVPENQTRLIKEKTEDKPLEQEQRVQPLRGDSFSLVAVGTSTGGPKALHEVLSNLPLDLNSSILIVQHMPPRFTNSLAQRLNSVSAYNVKEAENGECVKKGWAYIAPGDYHMEVSMRNGKYVINLSQSPTVNGHRPSVDVLFYSAAKLTVKKIGVIMTGMGSDGALGLKAMKESGAYTIAENQDTSVVYGMPKVAAGLGIVDYEVPLYRIADYIVQVLNRK